MHASFARMLPELLRFSSASRLLENVPERLQAAHRVDDGAEEPGTSAGGDGVRLGATRPAKTPRTMTTPIAAAAHSTTNASHTRTHTSDSLWSGWSSAAPQRPSAASSEEGEEGEEGSGGDDLDDDQLDALGL